MNSTSGFETIGALAGAGTVNVEDGTTTVTSWNLTVGGGDASGTFTGTIAPVTSTLGFNLIKVGNGTQVLSGVNTMSVGSVVLNGGTLDVETGSAFGTSAVPVTVNAGGTLNLSTGLMALTTGALTVNPGGTVNFGIASATPATATPSATTGYDVENVSGTASLAGNLNLSLVGGFTPTYGGGQTFTLINASSINGTFAGLPNNALVNLGGVYFKIVYTSTTVSLVPLATAPTIVTVTTGQTLNSQILAAAANTILQVSGTFNETISATNVNVLAVEFTGNTTINGFNETTGAVPIIIDAGATLTMGDANNDTYNGTINGAGNLVKVGTGTDTLSGSDGLTGTTSVIGGVLSASAANAFPNGPFVVTGTLQLNGFNETIGSLIGAGVVDDNNANAVTLTTAGASGTTTFTGTIIPGTTVGVLNLVKTGGNTQILTGTDTYTGTTSVLSDTLQIGIGAAAGTLGTGGVSISTGGTLAFDRSDAGLAIANVISGAGTMLFMGQGARQVPATTSPAPTRRSPGTSTRSRPGPPQEPTACVSRWASRARWDYRR